MPGVWVKHESNGAFSLVTIWREAPKNLVLLHHTLARASSVPLPSLATTLALLSEGRAEICQPIL